MVQRSKDCFPCFVVEKTGTANIFVAQLCLYACCVLPLFILCEKVGMTYIISCPALPGYYIFTHVSHTIFIYIISHVFLNYIHPQSYCVHTVILQTSAIYTHTILLYQTYITVALYVIEIVQPNQLDKKKNMFDDITKSSSSSFAIQHQPQVI